MSSKRIAGMSERDSRRRFQKDFERDLNEFENHSNGEVEREFSL